MQVTRIRKGFIWLVVSSSEMTNTGKDSELIVVCVAHPLKPNKIRN